jgi:hypothetical protein
MDPEREPSLARVLAIFVALAAAVAVLAVLVHRPSGAPIELAHRLNRPLPLDAAPTSASSARP